MRNGSGARVDYAADDFSITNGKTQLSAAAVSEAFPSTDAAFLSSKHLLTFIYSTRSLTSRVNHRLRAACPQELLKQTVAATGFLDQNEKVQLEIRHSVSPYFSYRRTVSPIVSRNASSPNVLSFKNIAWLPPDVIAQSFIRPSASRSVRFRLTRLPPSILYRS